MGLNETIATAGQAINQAGGGMIGAVAIIVVIAFACMVVLVFFLWKAYQKLLKESRERETKLIEMNLTSLVTQKETNETDTADVKDKPPGFRTHGYNSSGNKADNRHCAETASSRNILPFSPAFTGSYFRDIGYRYNHHTKDTETGQRSRNHKDRKTTC